MSDSVRPHRWHPTRLPHPWASPGKNIGVGCHFLLQRMKVKSESEVVQSCPTLHDPMDCSLPGSSVHGIFQQEYWSGVPLPSLGCFVRIPVNLPLLVLLLNKCPQENMGSQHSSATKGLWPPRGADPVFWMLLHWVLEMDV